MSVCMICPECKGQYAEGIFECPDCEIPLKEEDHLAPSQDTDEELVPVLEITDVSFIPLVKSLLEGAGIPHILQGEHAVGILAMPPTVGAVSKAAFASRLLVPRSKVAEVKELLAHFEEGREDDA